MYEKLKATPGPQVMSGKNCAQVPPDLSGPRHPGVQHPVEQLHPHSVHHLRLRVDREDLGQGEHKATPQVRPELPGEDARMLNLSSCRLL